MFLEWFSWLQALNKSSYFFAFLFDQLIELSHLIFIRELFHLQIEFLIFLIGCWWENNFSIASNCDIFRETVLFVFRQEIWDQKILLLILIFPELECFLDEFFVINQHLIDSLKILWKWFNLSFHNRIDFFATQIHELRWIFLDNILVSLSLELRQSLLDIRVCSFDKDLEFLWIP